MKKLTLLFLTIVIALVLFGCVKGEDSKEQESNHNNEITTSKVADEETTQKALNVECETISTTDKEVTKDGKGETTKEENTFNVTFKDYNGDILKEEKVKKGEAATAPVPPKRDGFVFVKWDTYYKEVEGDIVITAIYRELTEPTLIVDAVEATKKDVTVKISMVNNPGLLALLLKIDYDEDAMSLEKVESGSSMKGYSFISPKNKKAGCNAAWNIVEAPENAVDGEVAILHFKLKSDAKKGIHDIAVSCYDGAFDSNYEPVKFKIIDGSVNIL